MNNSTIVTLLIIGIIVLGLFAWFQMPGTISETATTTPTTTVRDTRPATSTPIVATTTAATTTATTSTATTTGERPDPITFEIRAKNFEFSPDTLNVKRGQQVTINFTSDEGTHDFVLDEFTGARTRQLGAGQSQTITFVADKTGAFEYYCSVGTHREMGMVGSLVVTP